MTNNTEALKTLIGRLNAGESLEDVSKDFAEKFSSVSAQEILDAEQQLIKEGTPAKQVQKLCNIHSVLFHTSCNHSVDAVDFDSLEATPRRLCTMRTLPLKNFWARSKLLTRKNVFRSYRNSSRYIRTTARRNSSLCPCCIVMVSWGLRK